MVKRIDFIYYLTVENYLQDLSNDEMSNYRINQKSSRNDSNKNGKLQNFPWLSLSRYN